MSPCEDGSPSPYLERQVELAFKNPTAILMAAGCSMDDMVDMTTFHTDPEARFETFLAVGDRLLGEPLYPKITCIRMTWLAGFDFEIEVVARIPTPARSSSMNAHVAHACGIGDDAGSRMSGGLSMFLITGASGNIGGRVAELLTERDAPVRRFVRHAAPMPDLTPSDVAIGDYGDRASLARAMEGVETVFLASAGAPPFKRAALHGNVMDAAAEAGAKRLVYLSFQSASATSPFPYSADHLLSEAHLKQSGLAWTILRDSFYQELIPTLADADGVVRDPGGDGRVAWVAREDVAQAVAAALLDDNHTGCTYDITGPEAWSLEEAARLLASVNGGVPRYCRETVEEGRRWRAATGAAEWEVETWLGSYLAMGTGELAHVSDAVRKLTGRDPAPIVAAATGSRLPVPPVETGGAGERPQSRQR